MGKYAHNKNEILKISDSQKAYNERVAAYSKNEALYQGTLRAVSSCRNIGTTATV